MKVVSYLGSVPLRNSNKQKTELLVKYAKGVSAVGDQSLLHTQHTLVDADVGVIQGWVYDNVKPPHLQLRKQVIDTQLAKRKFVVCADASLFNYVDKTNPHGYLRYSFNGVFPTTGIYCDDKIDPNRWNSISNKLNIHLEDTKARGSCIILMLQRQGGWSMGGKNVEQWAFDTINQIRKYSDRPIIVRPHPGDKQAPVYLNPTKTRLKNLPNVKISPQGRPLEEELHKAWAVVNHNSSAAVGPIIQGYHCFITDPKNSQNAEVSHTDFSLLENPTTFDRERWLQRISMFHWSFKELESGECWQHMRNYCQ